MEETIVYLKRMVAEAQAALSEAVQKLEAFQAAPEQNVFDTLEEAENKLEDRLSDLAFEDCQGAGNCGAGHYEQEFIVGEKHYLATYTPEYNRHDKPYYYVDGSEFTIKELTETPA